MNKQEFVLNGEQTFGEFPGALEEDWRGEIVHLERILDEMGIEIKLQYLSTLPRILENISSIPAVIELASCFPKEIMRKIFYSEIQDILPLFSYDAEITAEERDAARAEYDGA